MNCVDYFSFSTSDCGGHPQRTSPAQTFTLYPPSTTTTDLIDGCIKRDTDEFNIGFLFPIFSHDIYDAAGHSSMLTAAMAVAELNNKRDGVFDRILPNTLIKFEWIDSQRSSSAAILGALRLVDGAFNAKGADVVLGAASSSSSTAAQHALKAFNIPQLSYSSTSPDLSDSVEYPTFFRTVPSDEFQSSAIIDFLLHLDYHGACVINTDRDSYSSKGSVSLQQTAAASRFTIFKNIITADNPTEGQADGAVALLKTSECRVVVLMTQAPAARAILKSAARNRVFGSTSEYLWVFPDAITNNIDAVTRGDADLSTAIVGSVGIEPLKPKGDAYDAFVKRYLSLSDTRACFNGVDGVDSAGTSMYEFGRECYGFAHQSIEEVSLYALYAYDAVYAFAHAAQRLVDAGAEHFDTELMQEALKNISFAGVTGSIFFEENGDREIGCGYTITNFNEFNSSFSTALGDWTVDGKFEYYEGVSEASIVWPTESAEKPRGSLSSPSPTSSTEGTIIACVVTVVLYIVGKKLYTKFGRRAVKIQEEKTVEVDKKLRRTLNIKIRQQNGFMMLELGDVATDVLTGVVFSVEGRGELPYWIWCLFITLGFYSLPLGAWQILKRGRVKTSFR